MTQYPERPLSLSHPCPGSLPSYYRQLSPLGTCPKSQLPPHSSSDKLGQAPFQHPWGPCQYTLHPRNVTAAPSGNQHPLHEHVRSPHSAGPSTLTLSFPSVRNRGHLQEGLSHAPPATGHVPNPTSQNRIFCLKHYQRRGRGCVGGKSSRRSPESCHFLISETPSPGWARRRLGHSVSNLAGHLLRVRASKMSASPGTPPGTPPGFYIDPSHLNLAYLFLSACFL